MIDRADREAVRASYDAVAGAYAEQFENELDVKPLDRALLSALLEQAGPSPAVADLGCGPGHVGAWLAANGGASVVGIDLSPGMVALAKENHPGLEFRTGDLVDLPATDGEFDALVALYCIIHVAPAELGHAFSEMRRVLRPGGQALVSFHIGDELIHRDIWWEKTVDLDFQLLDPVAVTAAMASAGLQVQVAVERVNYPGEAETRRCYLFARR